MQDHTLSFMYITNGGTAGSIALNTDDFLSNCTIKQFKLLCRMAAMSTDYYTTARDLLDGIINAAAVMEYKCNTESTKKNKRRLDTISKKFMQIYQEQFKI